MDDIKRTFEALGEKLGLAIAFDDAGSCEMPLADGRHLHLQLRANVGEAVLAVTLGTVPDELRGKVFQTLLAANYYWNETLGGTISWQNEIEQVVYAFALPVATTDAATLERVFTNFMDAQAAWAERLSNDIDEAAALQEEEAIEAREEAGEDDELLAPPEPLQMIFG